MKAINLSYIEDDEEKFIFTFTSTLLGKWGIDWKNLNPKNRKLLEEIAECYSDVYGWGDTILKSNMVTQKNPEDYRDHLKGMKK